MSQAPPPYPGDEKGGSYPPPPNPSYPPQGFTNLQTVDAYSSQPTDPPPAYSSVNKGTPIILQPNTVTVIQDFRESPVHTKCPHCQAEIVTATHYETGTLAWISAVVLCCVGLDFGCCLIPFFADSCKDVIHTCPNCSQSLSRYTRM